LKGIPQGSYMKEFRQEAVKLVTEEGLSWAEAARYASMKELRLDYPLAFVRRVLRVSASGYYAWVDRPLSKWAQEETRLEVEIKAAHKWTRQTYGPERLRHDLAEHGIRVGICRIKRIRRKLGICCNQKRKFKATTDSNHTFPVAAKEAGGCPQCPGRPERLAPARHVFLW